MAYYTITSKKELKDYARQYASRLKPGDIVGLVGELGAGKTTLVQFIGEYLGVSQLMRSPTFTYVKVYPLKNGITLIHADAYRLSPEVDVRTIGLDEYYHDTNTILLVEWADIIRSALPPSTKWIYISRESDTVREIDDDTK